MGWAKAERNNLTIDAIRALKVAMEHNDWQVDGVLR